MRAVRAVVRRGLVHAWRHRWTFAVPVVTLLLPATILAVQLPDVYETKAVVHVRPLRPENIGYALPRESADRPDEVMATVPDRLFARPMLQQVLPVLLPGRETSDPQVLEDVAGFFDFDRVGPAAFELQGHHRDPETATRAVNRLLEAFLESERADRLRRAERNREFHEGELETARAEYDAVYDRLEAFRAEHHETLPDRKDAIESELSRLRMEIASQEGVIGGARARIEMLDQQLLSLVTDGPEPGRPRPTVAEEALRIQLGEEQRALNALEQELAQASATKTDRHPDVVRLKGAVAVHRQAVAETTAALERLRQDTQAHALDTAEAQLARRREILTTLMDSSRATLENAQARLNSLHLRSEALHGHLRAMPTTAQALEPLLRELEQSGNRLEAREQAASHARAAVAFYGGSVSDVTGFRVSAWAVVPVQPSGPGRWRYLATALVLGLLAGYGLLLLRRQHEGAAVTRPEDLADLFPAAVIVRVPRLADGRRRGWRPLLGELALGAYVVFLLGATVFLLAAHRGAIPRPEWLQGLFAGGA